MDRARSDDESRVADEREQGPARADPATTPIGDAIEAFHARDGIAYAIPAHRSGTGGVRPDAARWLGEQAFAADVGMRTGVDTRNQAGQVEATATELFARALGADLTLFSTGGATQDVHIAMTAAVRPGETVVMARNGHRSAFSGLVHSGAHPVYVDPVYDDRLQVAHGVDPAELERVLDAHPHARAVLVFTPTHYGVSSDVAGLARVAHDHAVPLLTDDAWGLDHAFCSRLPPSSLECGADLAIGSVHKSLNGLGQTSVLSVQGDRIDRTRLRLAVELFRSTSASPLLLSSIDGARAQFERDGEELLGRAIDLAHRMREAVFDLPELVLMGDDVVGSPGAVALDPTHVCVDVTRIGLTGFTAADWLRRHRGIEVELADHRRIMALVTFADTSATVERFVDGLRDLLAAHPERGTDRIPEVPPPAALRMETVMTPREAFLGRTELVDRREAAGRVSAEMVCPYPLGVPVAAPGERLTDVVIDHLGQLAAAGVQVEGAADESLGRLRVVA